MNRPTLEVADLLRAHGDLFLEKNRAWLSYQHLTVLRALKNCRTAALGGHRDRCAQCGYQALSYNSCRNRHCPKCQAQARQRWLAARQQELLGVPYFHVVFTLPHQLNPLCQRQPALLYNLLFQASAETLLEVAADPKHLGAHIGFLSLLHTWGQNLSLHPHVHCVVPAGGFSLDRQRWIHPPSGFFLPVRVLSRVFRGKFLARLRQAFQRHKLSEEALPGFASLLDQLFRQEWVVYAKPAFGGPDRVLHYLGRYTHRVAISNHRLVAFEGEHVTFRWTDYAQGHRQRLLTVHVTEFLRRYVQHILPRGFVRIRHYGYLTNRCREEALALGRQFLNTMAPPREAVSPPGGTEARCPACGGRLIPGPPLTAQQVVGPCDYIDTS